jgi:SRSO17 transposase
MVEWPEGDAEPAKYWLGTLPSDTPIAELVASTKRRWRIERDYQELKGEIGIGHYEGRGCRGFHRHAMLRIAAYSFFVAERSAFPASAAGDATLVKSLAIPANFRPRGSANPA